MNGVINKNLKSSSSPITNENKHISEHTQSQGKNAMRTSRRKTWTSNLNSNP